ncbi:MAG: tRNA lysidine(34) synthetase TilS [Ghiorsea sp.]
MPKSVAVAWSGGADSTALLLLLREQNYEVQAWHVDHGWHKSSKDLAVSLRKQADIWGVDFHVKRIEKANQNIESEARKGRYTSFAELAKKTSCAHIALGHHADDQAETVCMRMLQGAGVAGCQGMKVHREQSGLHYWRPLLNFSRVNVELYLKKLGVVWLDDPSNQDTTLWRNKIRRQLFPAINHSGVNPQSLFLRWQKQAEQVQQEIEQLAEPVKISRRTQVDGILCEMDWFEWSQMMPAVRVYLLQKMIGLLFADGSVFGRRHILAIEAWRKHGGHGWLNLSGCCLYRQGQGLQLCQGKASLRDSSQNVLKDRGNQ